MTLTSRQTLSQDTSTSRTAGLIGSQLCKELEALGLALRLEGDKVMVAPPGKLDRHLRERITANRDALVRALTPVEGLDFGWEH